MMSSGKTANSACKNAAALHSQEHTAFSSCATTALHRLLPPKRPAKSEAAPCAAAE